MNQGEKNKKIIFFHNGINTDVYNVYEDTSYLAVDTEAMGLVHGRDRICLIQIGNKLNLTACIKIEINNTDSPNIKKLFEDKNIMKIFHYARFDVAALRCNLEINTRNIFCTKIASKLARTYTNKHGLKAVSYTHLTLPTILLV